MTTATVEVNHAIENAKAWLESITEMMDRLNHIQECRDEDVECGHDEEYHNEDAAGDEITESPLSVEVRSGWASHKDSFEAEEYKILLTTGGPALRIVGEIGEYGEPSTATLQHQDWGTPWTDYSRDDRLLDFARQFYFGE